LYVIVVGKKEVEALCLLSGPVMRTRMHAFINENAVPTKASVYSNSVEISTDLF
jgi:hypothetical protein